MEEAKGIESKDVIPIPGFATSWLCDLGQVTVSLGLSYLIHKSWGLGGGVGLEGAISNAYSLLWVLLFHLLNYILYTYNLFP